MISAPSLGDVPISIGQAPLAARRTRIVAWCGLGVQAKLGHQPRHHAFVKEVAANPELRELEFTVPKHFGRSGDGVILWVSKAVMVGSVYPEFSRERAEGQGLLSGPEIAWHPGKVGKGKRRGRFGLERLCSGGRRRVRLGEDRIAERQVD